MQASKSEQEAAMGLFSPGMLLDARQLFEVDFEALLFAHGHLAPCYACFSCA